MWNSSAFTSVPRLRASSVAPAPACTIIPAGLFTTARNLSSYRMSSGISSATACSGAGCGSPSISIASPPRIFCLPFAAAPSTRTCPASISSCTRALLISGIACARYASSRIPAAAASATKLRTPSSNSVSSSRSSTGTTTSGSASTPRVALYSARTDRRLDPLRNMFIDGIAHVPPTPSRRRLAAIENRPAGPWGEVPVNPS